MGVGGCKFCQKSISSSILQLFLQMSNISLPIDISYVAQVSGMWECWELGYECRIRLEVSPKFARNSGLRMTIKILKI